MRPRFWLIIAVALVPLCAGAAQFEAIVTHVGDGDTLSVRPLAGGPPQRIRIQGIDAPEICQRFGTESRDALAGRVMGRRVLIDSKARDGYDRTVARILLARQDVGAWMVSRGYAWSYRFKRNPGPYRQQEAWARRERLGLWQSAQPLSPREFRQRHGSCH
jgi:micrococcal nuclease